MFDRRCNSNALLSLFFLGKASGGIDRTTWTLTELKNRPPNSRSPKWPESLQPILEDRYVDLSNGYLMLVART
jgi:hypothetical protein